MTPIGPERCNPINLQTERVSYEKKREQEMNRKNEILFKHVMEEMHESTSKFIKRARVNHGISFLTRIDYPHKMASFVKIEITAKGDNPSLVTTILPVVTIEKAKLTAIIAPDGTLYRYHFLSEHMDAHHTQLLSIVSEPNSADQEFPLCTGMDAYIKERRFVLESYREYPLKDNKTLFFEPILPPLVWTNDSSDTDKINHINDRLKQAFSTVDTLSNGYPVAQISKSPLLQIGINKKCDRML
ncbi:MAG TPA: hypothetical protein VJH96_00170 [Patescibacteria group bacterium]|nr:hypothetical protein [Patescibacteria group bacterium]